MLALRRRHVVVNGGVQVADNFRRHRTGRNAALVAHYGFLSIFPLMIVFTTIIGFVLDGNPHLRDTIIDSVLSQVPIIGDTISRNPASLSGSWTLLVVGLLTVLWAALKAFNVLQMALDDVAEVHIDDRPNMVMIRVRSLLGIAVIGGAQVGAATLSVLVAQSRFAVTSRVLLVGATVALNIAALAATYRWLCSRPPSWRGSLPGAVVGGIAFSVVQYIGASVVARAISHASPVYGTFASVIGLMAWLSLHALIALAGAELNAIVPLRPYDRTTLDDASTEAATPR